jgi:HlyD family secretion protein
VSEGDVGRLEPGMNASFTVDAFPGKKFRGTISEVRNAPTTVQNVVTYDAVIKVDNDELKLKPGMTANVTIVYAQRDDVLAIPNAALRFKPSGLTAPSASAAPPSGSSSGAPAGSSSSGRHWQGGEGPPGGRGSGGRGNRGNSGKNPDGTETRTVWVMHGDTPSPVTVTIGLSDGTNSEIVSGDLHEGDQVATEQEGGTAAAASAQPQMKRLF